MSSNQEYRKLVEIACNVFNKLNDPHKAGIYSFCWLSEQQQNAHIHNQKLIDEAMSDKFFFDLLCKKISKMLRSKRSIPDIFLVFACEILDGTMKPPKGKRRPESDFSFSVSSVIAEIYRQINHMDLYMTRNDASEHQLSGLDAVSDAIMLIYKRKVSYRTLVNEYYPSAIKQAELDEITGFKWLE